MDLELINCFGKLYNEKLENFVSDCAYIRKKSTNFSNPASRLVRSCSEDLFHGHFSREGEGIRLPCNLI